MSCKEFEGQGPYIHFCDNTNLIRHRKDTFVSICQSHQSLSTVLTVKVLGMCYVGTRFARDFTSEETISESLGFLPADCHPAVEDSAKECEPCGVFRQLVQLFRTRTEAEAIGCVAAVQSMNLIHSEQVVYVMPANLMQTLCHTGMTTMQCRSQQLMLAFILSGL